MNQVARWSLDRTEPHSEPASAQGSPCRMLYAVGDIHGMDDLLGRLLHLIADDATGLPHTVVFLGDAVNRGPHTRAVIDRLVAGPPDPIARWIVLRGNHEQAMLDALAGTDTQAFARWLKRGGAATLRSYGGGRKDATPERARALVGAAHLAFLATLPLMHREGDHLFVHAGVAPGVPLDQQTPETLMTIREPFLRRRHRLPFTVIHGHTPTEGAPLLGPRRIGIDTGACMTGVLTAIAINRDDGTHRFLRARADGASK